MSVVPFTYDHPFRSARRTATSARLRCLIRRFAQFWFVAVCLATSAPLPSQTPTTGGAPTSGITVASPLDYQVFQRSSLMKGKVVIRGRANLSPGLAAARVEARLIGNSLGGPLKGNWLRLRLDRSSGAFDGTLVTVPGGFYRLDVRLLGAQGPAGEAAVSHVGVGEVFVIAGQSNATNYGEVRQTTETGMVAVFSGDAWQPANDPEPGVQDQSSKGSFMPAFGDALFRKFHVPIGVAPVGHGSTSVRQWLPAGERVYVMPTMTRFVSHNAQNELVSDGTLYDGMMKRIHQLGKHGFRALLWHQGESDAHQAVEHSISAEQYRTTMVELIRASRESAGWKFPWMVAEATYHSPKDSSDSAIERAQQSLWQSGIALEGPNTDTLGSEFRQDHGAGVHFSDAGLKAHGALWAQAVENYLDRILH